MPTELGLVSPNSLISAGAAEVDEELAEALVLSARETLEAERRSREEDELLQRILELSLLEK